MKKDMIDFSQFCGMYHGGGTVTFKARDGQTHTITGTGDVPRAWTLDGAATDFNTLKRITRNRTLGQFVQAGAVNTGGR